MMTQSALLLGFVVAVALIVSQSSALVQLGLQSCSQSSVVDNSTCEKAINGFTQELDPTANCSRLGSETGGWWRAIAKWRAYIELIRIYNRVDCCMDSLTDFTVTVDGVKCIEYSSEETFMNKTFTCGQTGHVIQIFSKKPSLTLCEVQAFGEYVNNDVLLPFTHCDQSSPFLDDFGKAVECSKAMDRNVTQTPATVASTCARLGNSHFAWWLAQAFPRRLLIRTVLIYNLIDPATGLGSNGLNNILIILDHQTISPCASYNSSHSFAVKSFYCHGVASTLSIDFYSPSATLCEVQIFGEYLETNGRTRLQTRGCSQSSTLSVPGEPSGKYVCDKAQDHVSSLLLLSRGHCSSTTGSNGWWMSTTMQRAFITLVSIYNGVAQADQRTNNGLHKFDLSVDNELCAAYDSDEFWLSRAFECYEVGRTVKIYSYSQLPLVLCEVEVIGYPVPTYDTLSFSRCSQSSDSQLQHEGIEVPLTCEKAIDGHTSSMLTQLSCAQVSNELGWWRGYLKKLTYIHQVRLVNRQEFDSHLYRGQDVNGLRSFHIKVDDMDICVDYLQANNRLPFSSADFDCKHIGSSITIHSLYSESYLTICEASVIGLFLDNDPIQGDPQHEYKLELNNCQQGAEFQRTKPISIQNPCNKAIDGSQRTRCTAMPFAKPWWRAYLKATAYVTLVRIFNRMGSPGSTYAASLYDFFIQVDQHTCAHAVSSEPFAVKTLECYIVGRLVTVNSRKPNITLCEVEVFGRYSDKAVPIGLSDCSQSSTIHSIPSATCDKAIDWDLSSNVASGKCAFGGIERGWWQAKTSGRVRVKRVRVKIGAGTGSAESSKDFSIVVDDDICGAYRNANSQSKDIFCDIIGSNITIVSHDHHLVLCEVTVFGYTQVNAHYNWLRTVKCLPEYPTYTTYECDRVPADVPRGPLGPLICNASQLYSMPRMTTIPWNYFDVFRRSIKRYIWMHVAWYRAMTYEPAYFRTVNIALNDFRPLCYNSKFAEFVIAVDGVQCGSYSRDIPPVEDVYGEQLLLRGKNFTCNLIGQVVEIASKVPCTISVSEVIIYGEYIRKIDVSAKEWLQPLCTQKVLLQSLGLTNETEEHYRLLGTVLCRPEYPTYSRYTCKKVPNPTGPLSCNLTGNYTLAGIDSVPSGYFDVRRYFRRDSWEYTGWFRAMTYQPSHIRTVNIALKHFNSTCYTSKFREFLIAVDGVPCATYSIYRSRENYDSAFRGRGMNFTCNAVGHVVEIVNRDPCTIDVSEVTLYGEAVRETPVSTKQWSYPLCTRRHLHEALDRRHTIGQ